MSILQGRMVKKIKCTECGNGISYWDSFKNIKHYHLFHVVCPSCKYPNKIKKKYILAYFVLGFVTYFAGKYSVDSSNALPVILMLVISLSFTYFTWHRVELK